MNLVLRSSRVASSVLRVLAAASFALAGCSDEPAASSSTGGTAGAPPSATTVTPPPFGEPYDWLEDWNLFADLAKQTPAERVEPYDVVSPLFSDYTTKSRWVFVPEGERVAATLDDVWDFPVGTILVKSFGYAADLRAPSELVRLIETRLLWREPSGWSAHTYVYDESGGTAVRTVPGAFVPLEVVWSDGATRELRYHVPNTNECKDCHQASEVVRPLGPRTRQLDRLGADGREQLERFDALGWFERAPERAPEAARLVDPFDDSNPDVSTRVRSYFDANCSHCHSPAGMAASSGLFLDFLDTEPGVDDDANWGVCKIPTSAGGATCGNTFDVVPGDPDASVLVCRMTTLEIDMRMPPLASAVVHEEGLELVRAWIEAMPPASCSSGSAP
jgi:uncharacterized repeat protein (TIGR03806 family)